MSSRPGVDLSVVLSEPVRVDPNDGHDYGAAIAALDSGRSLRRPVAPRFSEQERLRRGGRADRRQARLLGDGRASSTRNGPGSSPRLTLPDNTDAATATSPPAINRIAKVMALQRMAGIGAEEKFGLGNQVFLIKAQAGGRSRGRLRRGSC